MLYKLQKKVCQTVGSGTYWNKELVGTILNEAELPETTWNEMQQQTELQKNKISIGINCTCYTIAQYIEYTHREILCLCAVSLVYRI